MLLLTNTLFTGRGKRRRKRKRNSVDPAPVAMKILQERNERSQIAERRKSRKAKKVFLAATAKTTVLAQIAAVQKTAAPTQKVIRKHPVRKSYAAVRRRRNTARKTECERKLTGTC